MPHSSDPFALLLDEYIGFVGDLPADAEFDGHFILEGKINAEGTALGLGRVFDRTEFRGKTLLTVYRPHGIGHTTYHDLPLRGFRNNDNFPQKERTQLIAVLREWQRAARTNLAESAETRPKEPARPRLTKDKANNKAREYLRTHPNATIRELSEGIGCSSGLVSRLPAWKAAMEQRNKGRQSRNPAVVSLTPKLEQVVGTEDESLAKLVEEQKADGEPSPLEDDPSSDREGAPRRGRIYRKR